MNTQYTERKWLKPELVRLGKLADVAGQNGPNAQQNGTRTGAGS